MTASLTVKLPADRIEDVISAARDRLFEGLVDDPEAVTLAIEMGIVRRCYEGASGFMGLAKLELVR